MGTHTQPTPAGHERPAIGRMVLAGVLGLCLAAPAAAAEVSPYKARDCIAKASAMIAFAKILQENGAGMPDAQVGQLHTLRDGWIAITVDQLQCKAARPLLEALQSGQKQVKGYTAQLGTSKPSKIWNREVRRLNSCIKTFGLEASLEAAKSPSKDFDFTQCQG